MRPAEILESTVTYAAWAAFAVATYVVTWFVDPYVFGFAVLGVGGMSGVVAICGLVVSIRSRDPARRRAVGALAALIAGAAVAAFGAARSIHWA